MPVVNIHAAKTGLSRLVDQAVAGEEVVIARAGKPLVKLVPVSTAKRTLGLLGGQLTIPDDFDAPLPDDVLETIYGGPLEP